MSKTMIATMSYVPTDAEAQRLVDSLSMLSEVARNNNYTIVNVFGGKGKEVKMDVKGELSKIGNLLVYDQKPGKRGTAIYQTVTQARDLGADVIVYTEPIKSPEMWKQIPNLVAPIASGTAELAYASRDAESLATFPRNQQITEGLFNELVGKDTGIEGDRILGPKAFTKDIVGYFDAFRSACPTDESWKTLMCPILGAEVNKVKTAMVKVRSPCPPQERNEITPKDTSYRVSQANDNYISYLIAASKKEDEAKTLLQKFNEEIRRRLHKENFLLEEDIATAKKAS